MQSLPLANNIDSATLSSGVTKHKAVSQDLNWRLYQLELALRSRQKDRVSLEYFLFHIPQRCNSACLMKILIHLSFTCSHMPVRSTPPLDERQWAQLMKMMKEGPTDESTATVKRALERISKVRRL